MRSRTRKSFVPSPTYCLTLTSRRVFALLGNAAASVGQGKIQNTDCLQQATADRAFTNAKAAGDVDGMVQALTFRALERNTGKVGLASVLW